MLILQIVILFLEQLQLHQELTEQGRKLLPFPGPQPPICGIKPLDLVTPWPLAALTLLFLCLRKPQEEQHPCQEAQGLRICLLMQETQVRSLGWEDTLEEEMATCSTILAWKIPWTEEAGRLQFRGSQKSQI